MWMMWLASALAAPVGHWHPDDLAPLSKGFAESSEKLQVPYGEASAKVEALASALRAYREGLDVLGERAPAAERERLEALEAAYAKQHAALQGFADQVIGDYDAAFTGAVERAAAARGETQQCPSTIPDGGPRIPGRPSKVVANPECVGEDLNAALAAAVDADPELAAAIAEILGRTWPEVTLPAEPQAVVGTGERWILVRELLVAGARDAMRRIENEDDLARTKIEAGLESESPDVEALKAEVKGIEAKTAAARAALAAPALAAAEKALAKRKGEPATAWCANPVALGGCVGTDVTGDLLGPVLDDKKVAKALGG